MTTAPNPTAETRQRKEHMDQEKCSFCEQVVDSVTTGSDGVTKACPDCLAEG